MSDAISFKYNVTVDLDPDVWAMSYGLEPHEVMPDAKEAMLELIRASVNNWFINSGNTGYARVSEA